MPNDHKALALQALEQMEDRMLERPASAWELTFDGSIDGIKAEAARIQAAMDWVRRQED